MAALLRGHLSSRSNECIDFLLCYASLANLLSLITNTEELSSARGLPLKRGDGTFHTPAASASRNDGHTFFSSAHFRSQQERRCIPLVSQPLSAWGSPSSWHDCASSSSVILTWRKLADTVASLALGRPWRHFRRWLPDHVAM